MLNIAINLLPVFACHTASAGPQFQNHPLLCSSRDPLSGFREANIINIGISQPPPSALALP